MSDIVKCWHCRKNKSEDEVDTCEHCFKHTCFKCSSKAFCCANKRVEEQDKRDAEHEASQAKEEYESRNYGQPMDVSDDWNDDSRDYWPEKDAPTNDDDWDDDFGEGDN
ncbi:hypothetical protein CCP1ISM_3020002 [Azospirillaceae bacterium]